MNASQVIHGSGAPRRSGFTLLEVLVGLAVGGIVILAGFTTLAVVHDRGDHAVEAVLPAMEGAQLRGHLVTWLSGAQRVASEIDASFHVERGVDVGADSDEVFFPTRSRTPLGAPVAAVRLYVDRDPDTPETGLVAEFLYWPDDVPVRIELAPGATALRVRCWPDVEPAVGWSDLCEPGAQSLPRGIELTLEADAPHHLPSLLRVPVRVAFPVLR
jgi:prepilin-type N-terminal cleavage/methylation domain-containing protein